MKYPSQKPVYTMLLVGFIVLFSYQNCGTQYNLEVKEPAGGLNSISRSPDGDLPKICLDKESGQSYSEGQQWSVSVDQSESSVCPDGSSIVKKYKSSTDYVCINEVIVPGETQKTPVLPVPVCPELPKECTDPATGKIYANAATWVVKSDEDKQRMCPMAPGINESYTVTTTKKYRCDNGVIQQTEMSEVVNPPKNPCPGGCIDQKQMARNHGDQWNIITAGVSLKSCEDGTKLSQANQTTQAYICQNGAVLPQGSSVTIDVAPMMMCPEPAKTCTDLAGVVRKEGEIWSTTKAENRPVVCPDDPSLMQAYNVKTTYKCTAGMISSEQLVTAQEPLSVCYKSCVDEAGIKRAHLATWNKIENLTEEVQCVDAPPLSQTYALSTQYKCEDGQISAGLATKSLVPPAVVCPDPVLKANFDTNTPVENVVNNLTVSSKYVAAVNYSCSVDKDKSVFAKGSIAVGDQKIPLKFTADSTCLIEAKTSLGKVLTLNLKATVDCSTRIKEGGSCRDFQCLQTQTLTFSTNNIVEIPERTAAGICYAVKIINAVSSGSSTLTKTRDDSVLARDHSNGFSDPKKTAVPYLMGRNTVNFTLKGDRRVKLSGGASDQSPIRVDNFVLVGIYPADTKTALTPYYQAYGTGDSTIEIAGGTAGNYKNILMNNSPVPLTAFESGGTSTVKALDVTTQVSKQLPYTIDVRAEDCGGARNLSEIFLFFQ